MNDVTPIRQLAPATQPISPAKFAHFVLRTGQIDRMTEWYQRVLAARIVFRDERLCFLSYDDEHHRLAMIQIPGLAPRDPEAAGTDHGAYSYRDRVELQIDNFATVAELDGYFHSPAFAANPVGVTYDPEELARQYEAGVPIADLLRIPPLPEGKTPWDMLSWH